jgi:hypothetical protein
MAQLGHVQRYGKTPADRLLACALELQRVAPGGQEVVLEFTPDALWEQLVLVGDAVESAEASSSCLPHAAWWLGVLSAQGLSDLMAELAGGLEWGTALVTVRVRAELAVPAGVALERVARDAIARLVVERLVSERFG